MSAPTGILQIVPELAGQTLLKGHKSALEAFGKKLEDKQKAWRALDVLMAPKPPRWDALRELAEEIVANNRQVIFLSEGLLDATARAAHSLLGSNSGSRTQPKLHLVSSNLSADKLASLGRELSGRRASLILAFEGEPSARLLWCFERLYAQLSEGRQIAEVQRRVIISAGGSWPEWAKKNRFRCLGLNERSVGRYLFFSEPIALLLLLSGVPAWQCVEGGRSLVRGFDKKAGLSDSLLAYSALREIQLGEKARESLHLPDESFLDFARWWRLLTEDSRQEFSEDQGESRFEVGSVMSERFPEKGRQWVTEIRVEGERSAALTKGASLGWPKELRSWGAAEPEYQNALESQRADDSHAQPHIRLSLRRLDPMSVGALFAFFEGVVSASHKLADLDDDWDLLQPRSVSTPIESQV